MAPKMRFLSMEKDDVVWEKLENDSDAWDKSVRTSEVYRAVVDFILRFRSDPAEVMHPAVNGGYNTVYRLEYKDGSSVIMRVPIKGVVQFPEEKIRYEVAIMRYVAAHTTIPVPHVYHYGTAEENPTGLGPFIIMDYIDHHENMSRALLDPGRPISDSPILNPNIDEEKLELLYSQMANVILQLSKVRFPSIGSLVESNDAERSISVQGRPLTVNMNEIVMHTGAPPSILPSQTYDSTNDWFRDMSEMHLAQLTFQHNDAVEDEDDARDKIVSRLLFRKLAIEKRLTLGSCADPQSTSKGGDFVLYSEDLRPANVLLDEDLKVVGVIDWEFVYAAPAQFSHDPPWWLLIESPECWPDGHAQWMKDYESRLQTFLRVLEAEERKEVPRTTSAADLAEMVKGVSLADNDVRGKERPLSQLMRESWEERTWMINYAARKSWAFDFIWWRFLDEKFFGPNEEQDHRARLPLLSERQREEVDEFVRQKMREREQRVIVDWEDDEAVRRMAQLLC